MRNGPEHPDPALTKDERARFDRDGFVHLKGVFGEAEISELRSAVTCAVDEQRQRGLEIRAESDVGVLRATTSDVLSLSALRPIALDRRIVGRVTSILGGTPLYFGYSSARIGGHGGTRSWHRDVLPRYGQPTRLVRAGIYLQDHARHSGGLAVKPRTHALPRFAWPAVPSVPLPIKRGDLLIWDMRTYHAGEVVRLRQAPSLPVPARLSGFVPKGLSLPEEADRMVIFLAFGIASSEFDAYMDSLRARDYMQQRWANSPMDQDVLGEIREAGLELIRPVPHYGDRSAPLNICDA